MQVLTKIKNPTITVESQRTLKKIQLRLRNYTKIADKISLSDDLDLYLKLISYQGFDVCYMYLGLRPEQDQLTKS